MSTTTKTEDAARENTAEETTEDAAALAAELAKLRQDLAALVENVSRLGSAHVEAFAGSEKVSESLAAGEAALTDFAAELREIERDITASTRKSPWRALGLAMVLGFLAGLLLRR